MVDRLTEDYEAYAKRQIETITEALTEVMFGNFTVVARTSEPDNTFGYLCAMINVAINAARNANQALQAKVVQLEAEVVERKAVQAALQSSEADLRITLDSIGDAVIATDADGNVLRCNPVAQKLTGYAAEDAIGARLEDIFKIMSADTRELLETPVERVTRTGKTIELAGNTILIARDGSEYHIADSGAPILNTIGEVVGVVIVFRDVTEQYRIESQLRQSQKMELVGQLAGGIAHDFNNMLAGIVGAADLLASDLDNPGAKENLDIIFSASERAASLVEALLAFSRKGSRRTIKVDVHQVIVDALAILERSIDRRVVIQREFEAATRVVLGDPTLLESTILNLGINACDAMPDGGILSITTSTRELDAEYCRTSRFDLRQGRYLQVTVSDSGVGIDEAKLAKIFEPYYTTKSVAKGTGLGLAMLYGTVLDHGGAVIVRSGREQGTTFDLLLPLADEPA